MKRRRLRARCPNGTNWSVREQAQRRRQEARHPRRRPSCGIFSATCSCRPPCGCASARERERLLVPWPSLYFVKKEKCEDDEEQTGLLSSSVGRVGRDTCSIFQVGFHFFHMLAFISAEPSRFLTSLFHFQPGSQQPGAFRHFFTSHIQRVTVAKSIHVEHEKQLWQTPSRSQSRQLWCHYY